MSLRKRYLPVVAVLGAGALGGGAVAIMPALATAGTSPASEVNLEISPNCYIETWACWNVKGTNPRDIGTASTIPPFTIAQGGTISFEDKEASHPTDVIWKGAAPSCTSGVPSTPQANWSGSCTFANAGTYEFESEGLYHEGEFNYTQYKVIVDATGGGGTTSTSTSTTMTTTAATTTSTTMTTTGHTTTMPGKSSHSSGSPLVGGSKALTLAGSQHGSTVRGSLKVSKAGAGGRLEVGILAAGGSRAKAGHSKQMSVGRLVRSSLKAGSVSFAVPLSAAGKAALRRDGRLSLTVKITLKPQHGAAVKITHAVVMHA